MDLDLIKDRLVKRKRRPIDVEREFAVLLPLVYIDGKLHLLYEMRAKNMKRQPREISFPGGAVEKGEIFQDAAIRETCEELNITRDKIKIISDFNPLVSSAGLRVSSYVGLLLDLDIDLLRPNIYEVDHVFTVPLDFFLAEEPDKYHIGFERKISSDFPYNLIPKGRDYDWFEARDTVYFYRYKDYVIWGLTAKITKNFIDTIKNK